ncbi:hypothetical protein EBH_0069060 [Eimeria brunetti]|uniref:Uncharacterized protein n=1 Tax=Eimeria brunetti TaxID=51314 RepID=U6LE54_9EIME|nr:hypothetical protein EBH_0069060 [Eimeria brunetti]
MPGPENSGPAANHPPRQASNRDGRSILRDNTEETPEERLLRMQEHFQKVVEFTLHRLASTFDRSLSSSDRRGGAFRAPPDFNGERPKDWLMQISQYYNALQMNVAEGAMIKAKPFQRCAENGIQSLKQRQRKQMMTQYHSLCMQKGVKGLDRFQKEADVKEDPPFEKQRTAELKELPRNAGPGDEEWGAGICPTGRKPSRTDGRNRQPHLQQPTETDT